LPAVTPKTTTASPAMNSATPSTAIASSADAADLADVLGRESVRAAPAGG